jgi:lipopolysaccharide/colanic/teichoic acid biosynthesis glycosyltransferase
MTEQNRQWNYKYAIEWIVCLCGIFFISPVLILLIILQKTFNPVAPIFYTTKRLGIDGNVFTLFKFRTMKIDAPVIRSADNKLITLENDSRITFYGRFLRLGFDELPQIFNIIKGDMCLIGPRPDMPDEYNGYDEREKIRLKVLPGITGLTQIMDGRSLHNRDNYELDVRYVLYSSFALDLKIILYTLPYSFGWKKIGQKYLSQFMYEIPCERTLAEIMRLESQTKEE